MLEQNGQVPKTDTAIHRLVIFSTVVKCLKSYKTTHVMNADLIINKKKLINARAV
jgi:hypothetical protein